MHGVVLGVISLVLCFGGPFIASLLMIHEDQGNPFPFVKVGAAGVWLMANAVGLILSAGGCAATWRSRPNAGYVLCILSHTGNWLAVAAFFFGMRYF